jgi:hypothetical protein
LHQAIHSELVKLPNIAIRHIKAHQDLSIPNAELLSQEAKLNIEADKLADEAYASSTFSDQVPMTPGVSAQLLIDGKTIVSKHRGYSPRHQADKGYQTSNSRKDRNDRSGF